MIILDTNIISELMKTSPNQNFITWLDQQDPMTLIDGLKKNKPKTPLEYLPSTVIQSI